LLISNAQMSQVAASSQGVLHRWIVFVSIPVIFLFACVTAPALQAATLAASPTATPAPPSPIPTILSPAPAPTSTPVPLVPNFAHIVVIVLENKEFGTVIGSANMPYFNQLATSYTLLTQYYAVSHPSLPNYLALIGGDTFGITSDCTACTVTAPSLPDLIEASGKTWKTYQEDMPSNCFAGESSGDYALKHDPFMYFTPIRSNADRCNAGVVPFPQLALDLAGGTLPNFSFITPNLCSDAHDCGIAIADHWLQNVMGQLQPNLDASNQPYLIIVTWDEGQGDHSCCGLPAKAGGRVATILISPQVQNNYQDSTPYTHFSLLKTISWAWHLAFLAHAADTQTALITAPWKK
jgi:phosphatidylinositol-3-phosphatase